MKKSFASQVADRCRTASPGTVIHMSSEAQPQQEVEVLWVDIEGVIGVGKSTLMGILAPRLTREFGPNRVFLVPENVEELMKSQLFQKYCRKPKKYAYEFQTMFFDARTEDFLTQWARIEQEVAETACPAFDSVDIDAGVVRKRVIILSERSILSDAIFMRVQFEEGHVKKRQLDNYKKLNSRWRTMYPICPGLVVYCHATIPLCQERIVERARDGEEVLVTPAYNTAVLREHERVFGNGQSVATFDMGNELKTFTVPVVSFDTTENYRDNRDIELKRSAEVISHIVDRMSPLPKEEEP